MNAHRLQTEYALCFNSVTERTGLQYMIMKDPRIIMLNRQLILAQLACFILYKIFNMPMFYILNCISVYICMYAAICDTPNAILVIHFEYVVQLVTARSNLCSS